MNALLHIVSSGNSSRRIDAPSGDYSNNGLVVVDYNDALVDENPNTKMQQRSRVPLMVNAPSFPFVPLPFNTFTRFHIEKWEELLNLVYRNTEDIPVLLHQIANGVDLGYSGDRIGYIFRKNHPSSNDPLAMKAIDEEIMKELSAGRMAGPFDESQIRSMFPYFKTSMLAAVPKADSEELRIIDDLTHGEGSVNEWISDEEAKVRYTRFDKALHFIRKLGRGCWLAKIDWRSAFRQIGVCRDDWPLLGIHWRNQYFVRLVLPFGARSSPERFTRFSKAFAGILRRKDAKNIVDYLDDFLLVEATEERSKQSMNIMDRVANKKICF
jgi:hypothetical protein